MTDYRLSAVPRDYACDRCGVTDCKLWRAFNDGAVELRCCDCAASEADPPKDVSAIDDTGRVRVDDMLTDQIGWYVPAVPSESGASYWGYTTVPANAVAWWRRLPTRAPLRVFYDGSSHVVARSRYDALRVSCEHLGERPEDYDASVFALVPLDKTIRITTESPGEAPDTVATKTAAEWAADGRGFLCSEDR